MTEAKPYGAEYTIQKSDCIGHVQKRMGTNLLNKKKEYCKRKLSDGRKIGGAGRLTEKLCDNLQRYYGQAIQDNLGDLDGMVKATKAILHHSWSTDDEPDHSFYQVGATSWCNFMVQLHGANSSVQMLWVKHLQLIILAYQKQLASQCLIVCLKEPFSRAAYVGALRTQMNRYMLQFGNAVLSNNMLVHTKLKLL